MSKIVSVHSFRGGTGKSNTTANLATVLAVRGRRVAIVDTDIQSPGVHVLFNLSEEEIQNTLDDYLWGKITIDQAAYDAGAKLTVDNGGSIPAGALSLVPSSMKPGDIARILREGYDVGLLNDGYQNLIAALNLDYLFVDTHPGLNEETLLSISVSDVLLLIMRPDKQDFQGTAVTVDVARKLEVSNLLLIVNRVHDSYDFESLRKQVTDTYQATVAGVLPNSNEMLKLASSDIFSLRFPDDPWSREIGRIADHLEAIA
ncbi:MAG: MinD/ParA family protein [Chloroflexi bacterium]|nr:MinD/ParA family protein [Chloroflexota bacterium]